MPPKPIQTATLLTLALGLAITCLWGLRSQAQAPHSILIVLDTVRADRLSMCGYDRPTSPTLQSLSESGYTSTCEAYTPGTWTLPSHASFFTGLDVLTHRAHALTDGIDDFSGTKARTRGLKDKHPTLAEQMSDRGYQSIALSGNPVINDGLGLTRGFEVARISEKFGQISEDRLVDALREVLDARDPARPTFLFLNIAEAHQPWKAVPRSVEWANPQRSLKYNKLKENDPWRRFS